MQIIIFTNIAAFPPSFPNVFPAACNPIWLWLFLLPSQWLSLPQELVVVPQGGGSLLLCLRGDRPVLLCKWESKWSGPSASQSFAMCLCMTLTWCPGMSPGHPRLFPNPEKCFAKQQLSPNSNATVPPRSKYSSCLCPHMATINSLYTSFFHVCLSNLQLDQILIFPGFN